MRNDKQRRPLISLPHACPVDIEACKRNFSGAAFNRRQALMAAAGMLAASGLPWQAEARSPDIVRRVIPSTGLELPVVGLGSWITFNVGQDAKLLENCINVVRAFFSGGGRMIDCSPMYGSSQATIGQALKSLGYPNSLFSAEKVWTSSDGSRQIEKTRSYWGVPSFDLIQIHNLVAWQRHLPLLSEMKAAGKLGYIGITTSHGLRHNQVEQIIAQHDAIDFVQITYNAVDRDVERRILPLAQERGVAVIVNRPYRQGQLTRRLEGRPLPDWAGEAGASSWAQLLLKFIISHPAVTCAIPATTRVDHVRENLACASGPMPDAKLRTRIANHINEL